MKIITTGDWHFGRDNDSKKHNEYLLEFIDFMLDYAKKHNIDSIYQNGDYFDNRSRMSIETLNYGIEGSKRIADSGMTLHVLTGNHDMYFKNRLDVSSTNALRRYADVVSGVRTQIINGKKILLVPWVTDGEMWDRVVGLSHEADYVIGHFEFKNFMMNENYMMEHGLSHREFRHVKAVITGHYHKRQVKDNVTYVGSPFPFDYNDANDLERGFCVLDTETGEQTFVDWHKVKILSLTYAEFLEYKEEGLIDEHTSVRIDLPDDADDATIAKASEEVAELPTTTSKLNYKGNKAKELMESDVNIEEVDNVDQTIIEAIRGISEPPADVNVEMLVSIYQRSSKESESGH